jgi:hypothetical protein
VTVLCFYCAKPVDPDSAHRAVRGWEVKGVSSTRRSGSDIVLREPLEEFACRGCILRRKHGLSTGQGRLV